MKKNIAYLMAVGLLSLSGYATAAMSAPSGMPEMTELGTISVSNQSTLSDIEQALQAKMEQNGGSHYQITSISGHNQLHSTAIIYR